MFCIKFILNKTNLSIVLAFLDIKNRGVHKWSIRQNFFSNFTVWHFSHYLYPPIHRNPMGEILHFPSVRQHYFFSVLCNLQSGFYSFSGYWQRLLPHLNFSCFTLTPSSRTTLWERSFMITCKKHYIHPLGTIISYPFILFHSL